MTYMASHISKRVGIVVTSLLKYGHWLYLAIDIDQIWPGPLLANDITTIIAPSVIGKLEELPISKEYNLDWLCVLNQ